MPISSKRTALTSVAYAVTLIVVATTASSQFNETPAAKAASVEVEVPVKTAPAIRAAVPTQVEVFASYRNSKLPLTGAQLAELLTAVGFEGAAHKIAWGVAMRESNARPLAHNDSKRTGDSSYGIYQINMIYDLGPERRKKFGLTDNNQLFDPVLNTQVAFLMTGGGDNWGSWGIGPDAYRSGAGMSTLKRLKEYPGVAKVMMH
jgi:hypothetical protein